MTYTQDVQSKGRCGKDGQATKKHIPYITAAIIGFHLRWIASALRGWDYSMSGMDIAAAITCIIMVWAFKGAFLTERRTSRNALQRSNDRQGGR